MLEKIEPADFLLCEWITVPNFFCVFEKGSLQLPQNIIQRTCGELIKCWAIQKLFWSAHKFVLILFSAHLSQVVYLSLCDWVTVEWDALNMFIALPVELICVISVVHLFVQRSSLIQRFAIWYPRKWNCNLMNAYFPLLGQWLEFSVWLLWVLIFYYGYRNFYHNLFTWRILYLRNTSKFLRNYNTLWWEVALHNLVWNYTYIRHVIIFIHSPHLQ